MVSPIFIFLATHWSSTLHQGKYCLTKFTRFKIAVESVPTGISLETLSALCGWGVGVSPGGAKRGVRCVSVEASHAPIYLGGRWVCNLMRIKHSYVYFHILLVHVIRNVYLLLFRYIKLSRELSQSPWVLKGERMMESSVQEIIFQPIADLYG